jgi:hypothetical protein
VSHAERLARLRPDWSSRFRLRAGPPAPAHCCWVAARWMDHRPARRVRIDCAPRCAESRLEAFKRYAVRAACSVRAGGQPCERKRDTVPFLLSLLFFLLFSPPSSGWRQNCPTLARLSLLLLAASVSLGTATRPCRAPSSASARTEPTGGVSHPSFHHVSRRLKRGSLLIDPGEEKHPLHCCH